MKIACFFLALLLLSLPLCAQELQFQQEQYPFPLTFSGGSSSAWIYRSGYILSS